MSLNWIIAYIQFIDLYQSYPSIHILCYAPSLLIFMQRKILADLLLSKHQSYMYHHNIAGYLGFRFYVYMFIPVLAMLSKAQEKHIADVNHETSPVFFTHKHAKRIALLLYIKPFLLSGIPISFNKVRHNQFCNSIIGRCEIIWIEDRGWPDVRSLNKERLLRIWTTRRAFQV